jgi:hypothetical protein
MKVLVCWNYFRCSGGDCDVFVYLSLYSFYLFCGSHLQSYFLLSLYTIITLDFNHFIPVYSLSKTTIPKYLQDPLPKNIKKNICKIDLIKDLKGVKEYTRNYSLVDRDITCNI